MTHEQEIPASGHVVAASNPSSADLPKRSQECALVIRKLNCGIAISTEELHCADSIGPQIFHHDRRLSL